MKISNNNNSQDSLVSCFQCQVCNFRAKSAAFLRRHVTKVHGGPFVCDFPSCSFTAKRRSGITEHKKSHDPDQDKLKTYSCEFCSHRFRFKSNLLIHARSHTGDMPYACDFSGCTYRARQSGGLKAHRRKHDPDSLFKCDYPGCEYRATLKWVLKSHQDRHQPERKRDQQCPLCPKAFAVKKCLRDHIKNVHTKERPVGCSHCDLNFRTLHSLRLHTIRAHASQAVGTKTITERYKCSACSYQSKQKHCVLEHQQRSHSNARDFACVKCEYRAKCKGYLSMHVRRCHGPPRVASFECKLCRNTFFEKGSLGVHLNIVHTTEKRHKCQKCTYASKDISCLRRHEKKNHPKELARTQNAKEESSHGSLTQKSDGAAGSCLLNIDEGAKNDKQIYRCNFPGCSFESLHRSSLSNHKRRHLPQTKWHTCPMCPRKFCKSSALTQHIHYAHVKEKPFKCEFCEYIASTAADIREHKQRKHGNKVPVRLKDISPEKFVPKQQLGIDQIYSCPFCNWTHGEFSLVVRHTVIHRRAVVVLERRRLSLQ